MLYIFVQVIARSEGAFNTKALHFDKVILIVSKCSSQKSFFASTEKVARKTIYDSPY